MNKKIFMRQLEAKLRGLPKDEQKDALEYYEEYFADMGIGDDDDVTQVVGTPKDVAHNILNECLTKQEEENVKNNSVKNSVKSIWLVILGIMAAPVALPLIIAFAAVAFSLFITVVAVGVSAVACGITAIIVGVALIPGVIWASGVQSTFILGVCLLFIGITILMTMLLIELAKAIAVLLLKLYKKITKKGVVKNEY